MAAPVELMLPPNQYNTTITPIDCSASTQNDNIHHNMYSHLPLPSEATTNAEIAAIAKYTPCLNTHTT